MWCIKRGTLDIATHVGRMSCDYEGGNQGDVCMNQRTPKIASKPAKARGKTQERSFPN